MTPFQARQKAAALGGLAGAIGVLALAGCGGGSATSSSSSSASAAAGSAATVKVSKLPGYGSVLTTGSGQTLYLLSSDPAKSSKCAGACTSQWPPLIASGAPEVGSGARGSLLSTFKRSDGKQQVSYNGHALYTHAGAGATSGAGVAGEGGVWYLVSPSGGAVKSTASGGY